MEENIPMNYILQEKEGDGDLKVEPSILEFGTVKVGFHKKCFFSIYNPTMTNFYIKLEPEKQEYIGESGNMEEISNINDIISFDFKEGLINSFCKKDVSVLFKPINRYLVKMKVNIYATEHQDSKTLKKIILGSYLQEIKTKIILKIRKKIKI